MSHNFLRRLLILVNNKTFKVTDVADRVVRLCAMNLYLHGIAGDDSPVEAKDSLMSDPGGRFELISVNQKVFPKGDR